LKEQANKRKKCDQKQKAINKKAFLKCQQERRQKCDEKQKQSIDAAERLKRFKQSVRFGPIFVCSCCERKMFGHQVIEVDMENFKQMIDEKEPGLFLQCINAHSKANLSKTVHQMLLPALI
jgi:hypothetical protein